MDIQNILAVWTAIGLWYLVRGLKGKVREWKRAQEEERTARERQQGIIDSQVKQLVPDYYPEYQRESLEALGKNDPGKLQEILRAAPALRQEILQRLYRIAPASLLNPYLLQKAPTIPDLELVERRIQEVWRQEAADAKEAKRQSLPAGLRFRVLERDNFTCQYCGAESPDVKLHIDHIVPVSTGGRDTLENLVAACDRCNLGKSDRPLNRLVRRNQQS